MNWGIACFRLLSGWCPVFSALAEEGHVPCEVMYPMRRISTIIKTFSTHGLARKQEQMAWIYGFGILIRLDVKMWNGCKNISFTYCSKNIQLNSRKYLADPSSWTFSKLSLTTCPFDTLYLWGLRYVFDEKVIWPTIALEINSRKWFKWDPLGSINEKRSIG